ncbi:MAG: hypothetical protein AAFV49_23115, partial [Pseudomonadota bacterium]
GSPEPGYGGLPKDPGAIHVAVRTWARTSDEVAAELERLETARTAYIADLLVRAGIPAPLRAGALEASRLCARSYNLTLHEIVTRSPPPSARTAEDFAAIERDIDMHRQVCDLALSKHLGPPWDARLKRASQTLFLESGALMPMLQP